jgi:hypothetical protein
MKMYGTVDLVSFMAEMPYPQRKNHEYPLKKRLARPQNQSVCWGEEKNLLLLPGIEPKLSNP